MTHPLPPELERLIGARGAAARERAWGALIAVWSPLLLHVARSLSRDHDATMDAYAYILEQLRQRDFHRLRQYVAGGRSSFSTWLVVIARRLCLDHHRKRYGRTGGARTGALRDARTARFRLADLIGEGFEVAELAASGEDDPETRVRRAELRERLLESMDELQPGDRLLLMLRFADDVPVREIAGVLGMPTPFHGYRALNRALAKLRAALERRGVVDPVP